MYTYIQINIPPFPNPHTHIQHTYTHHTHPFSKHTRTQSPNATGFFGCVGKDAFGEQLKECAKTDGVDAHYKEDDEAPTGEQGAHDCMIG
jgi:hypothetical protein